jgi:hypothetical protein
VHTVLDDHSRVAYTEVHDDETAVTAVAVSHRAVGNQPPLTREAQSLAASR